MSTTQSDQIVERLGFAPGQVVQEIGHDDDSDAALRAAIEERTGTSLVDEDHDEVADAVLMWWRADDGDLTDALIHANSGLDGDGSIWLLTPTSGRPGHVESGEVRDACETASLSQFTSVPVSAGWTGTRVAPPKHRRR
ncbi:DUF3052 domain-containing protein [Streptomyces sp. NPDC057245]|uniref:DUF3052 domain-containing protein n=1 Tax=Streptomyces sp. NPDC057245 TaxID=3346065 RepID=UPI00363AB586